MKNNERLKLEVKAAERISGDVDYNNSWGEGKGQRVVFNRKKKTGEHKARVF